MKKCKCGCGKFVKKKNKFIYAHQNRGRLNSMYGVHRYGKLSPMYNKHHSKETKEKMSKIRIFKKIAKGKNNPMYNKHHTKEAKKKMSKMHKKRWLKNKEKYIGKNHPMYNKHHTKEAKEKMSKARKGKSKSKKTKKNISKGRKKFLNSPKGKEYLKNFHKIYNSKPNKSEKKLNSLLQKYFPNEYKYVGDGKQGSFFGKIPDFININGQKKIIELFGEFFHSSQDEIKRKEHFAKFGYKTLIVWWKELRNEEKLTEKIKEFNYGI